MTPSTSLSVPQTGERLLSLDFFRGVIMVILVWGETGFFLKLYEATPNSFTHLLATQFEHSQWRGLRFWDLLLPAFMFLPAQPWPFHTINKNSYCIPGGNHFLKF